MSRVAKPPKPTPHTTERQLTRVIMGQVSQQTLAALDRASGKLASAALASMDEQFAWFGRMPADQRASVQLIAQTGAAGFTA